MNTDRLIKYLKNDLSELTEIFNDLKPGESLSQLEIKMILNRINSVNEEFELLENEIETSVDKPKSSDTPKPKSKPENTEKGQPTQEINSYPDNIADVQEVSDKNITQAEQVKDQDQEPPVELVEDTEEEVITEEENSPMESIYSESVTEPIKEELTEKIEEEEIIEEPQKTIADKYQGASNSLNDHIANHIEQKDLASKLQQNPIDDLTKAIKLNDKIWYSNELFEGNLDLYRETIRTINKMEELDEALKFLENNFQFDQTQKSFKSFIEIIYRRFLK